MEIDEWISKDKWMNALLMMYGWINGFPRVERRMDGFSKWMD